MLSSLVSTQQVSSHKLDLWHLIRLGHHMLSAVKQVLLQCNFSFPRNETMSFCSSCELGKSHCVPFTLSQIKIFRTIGTYILRFMGSSNTILHNGFRFYIIIVDAYTRFTSIYFLKLESEVIRKLFTSKIRLKPNLIGKIRLYKLMGEGCFVL